MKTRKYIPSDMRIALISFQEAIAQRKAVEQQLLNAIRQDSEFIYECEKAPLKYFAIAHAEIYGKLIKAFMKEYQAQDTLKKVRAKYYE